jgi:hypothetical protein
MSALPRTNEEVMSALPRTLALFPPDMIGGANENKMFQSPALKMHLTLQCLLPRQLLKQFLFPSLMNT